MNKPHLTYGRQIIDETDIREVAAVLKSDWLTTGPKIKEFEDEFAQFLGVSHAVAVSSGTAALHCAMHALGIVPGDEVIVPPMTFAATANCILYQGGSPVFADVEQETLLIDPVAVKKKITPKTKAIIAVDYAGQPCKYEELREIAHRHGIMLVADACHSLGATYNGRKVGTLADLSCFSFHPVKHITTGEGGMVVTNDPDMAAKIRCFRNHGFTTDHVQRDAQGTWYYEMHDLGFNYRITDFQCALGLSQLKKLPGWIEKRRQVAEHYAEELADLPFLRPLAIRGDLQHAYHLYVVRFKNGTNGISRDKLFSRLRAEGIGVNVHYIPVHLHPFYQKKFGNNIGNFPVAETAFKEIISLPMHAGLVDMDIDRVIQTVHDLVREAH